MVHGSNEVAEVQCSPILQVSSVLVGQDYPQENICDFYESISYIYW